jgi:predicted O-methyltransferase YrrM
VHISLDELYNKAKEHQQMHGCGSVPYEQADLLVNVIHTYQSKRILEIGTGIGYSSAYMAYANPKATIHTIDKDQKHLTLAKKYWKTMHLLTSITAYEGKAHEIISNFYTPYDLIFFDGYTPQRKFFKDFDRLLKPQGILLTANLFLNNPTGGKYLEILKNTDKWQTNIVGDTAISIKLS